jgi:hypothetical protein
MTGAFSVFCFPTPLLRVAGKVILAPSQLPGPSHLGVAPCLMASRHRCSTETTTSTSSQNLSILSRQAVMARPVWSPVAFGLFSHKRKAEDWT